MFGIEHHQRRRRIRGFGYFKRLGPGFITGAADDDPSGIGTYSQVGAQFGYAFAWTAGLCLPLAIAVQEASARLGLVTGKGLSTLIRERYPRPVLYGAVLIVTVANTFNLGADLGSMAAATRLVVPIPYLPAVIGFALLILALELTLRYHRYAKVLRWLTLSLGAYVLVLFSVNVEWGRIISEAAFPFAGAGPAYFVALTAILGTTISPYLFFWQTAEEVEEEIDTAEGTEVARTHIRSMRLDVVGGMTSGVGIMFAIVVASAATLSANHITEIATAQQAAEALEPIAGHFAGHIFAIGIIGTGLLAIPVLAGSTAYALSDAFGWREGLSRSIKDAPGFYGTIIAGVAVGLVMNLLGLDPVRALFWAAVLNGISAPPLLLIILLLSRSESLLGEQKGGRLSQWVLASAAILMTAAPLGALAAR